MNTRILLWQLYLLLVGLMCYNTYINKTQECNMNSEMNFNQKSAFIAIVGRPKRRQKLDTEPPARAEGGNRLQQAADHQNKDNGSAHRG